MSVPMTRAVVDADDYEVVRYPADELWLRVVDRGDVQVTEYLSQDRDGPPPHSHDWDEVEYVIEGTVEFFIDGSWHRTGPGGVQMLPAGSAHSVRIPEGTARLLMITIGAPFDGFARDMAVLHASGDVTTEAIIDVGARHGVRLGGAGATAPTAG